MAGTNSMHSIADRWGRLRNFDFCSEAEPTQTWPYMTWINPTSQEIKVRNRTDTGWIAIGGTGGGDEKVKVSANDAAAGYLLPKLDAGAGIQLTELNDGGNEQVRITATAVDEKVKVSADDTTTNYLLSKLSAGTGIQLTELNPGGNEQVQITANASLDDAYNAGRIITADAGAVEIQGAGGLLSQGNLVLDDGAGDSPELQFVGGTHNDTISVFLDDDVTAKASDLVITLPNQYGGGTPARFVIKDEVGHELFEVTTARIVTLDSIFIGHMDDYWPIESWRTSTDDDDVKNVLRVTHNVSGGHAAAGFGGRLVFVLEDDTGNYDDAAGVDAVWDDPSNTSEDSHIAFNVRVAGAALAEICRIDGTGLAMVAGKDVYPMDDDGGLGTRLANWYDSVDHFAGGVLGEAWSWAGAPFSTPGLIHFAYPSLLYMGFDAGPTPKAFLYRTDQLGVYWTAIKTAPNAFADGSYVGVRLDDGTDNNYVESVIRKTTGTNTLELISRYRVAGGAPVVATHQTIYDFPMFMLVALQTWGTTWSNWGCSVNYGIDCPALTTYGVAAGLTWTPTRKGIVFYSSEAAPTVWRGPYIDVYYSTPY